MSKAKEQTEKILGFVPIENAVLECDRLSYGSKALYAILAKFQNRKTRQCNPRRELILKYLGTRPQNYYKFRKELETVGLIKIHHQRGGRQRSCQYDFPLKDGNKEEKGNLVKFLKTETPVIQVPTKKTVTAVIQGNDTPVIQPNCDGCDTGNNKKMNNMKNNNNREDLCPPTALDADAEQQKKIKKISRKNPAKGGKKNLSIEEKLKNFAISEMQEIGISNPKKVLDLYGLKKVATQLRRWHCRNLFDVRNRPGLFMQAIEENWEVPSGREQSKQEFWESAKRFSDPEKQKVELRGWSIYD